MLSWNLLNGPKHWESLKKKHGLPWKGSATCRCFSCYFGLNKGSYASNHKEIDFEIYLLTSDICFQKYSGYKCQLCIKVHEPPRLVYQVYVWAKYKDEILDVSGSNQIIEVPCKTKFNVTECQDLCFKSMQKLAKMNICKSNTKTWKIKWERYHSRLWFYDCFYCWHLTLLPKMFTS